MGKRSDFQAIERGFYPTPVEAIRPLVPHLGGGSYIEPCAGDGALVHGLHLLTGPDLTCVWAGDLAPAGHDIEKMDVLNPDRAFYDIDYVITNPPWDRKLLHRMILQFIRWAPTWLLFDADWIHTKQAAAYLPYCRKIVSIGRVKWFPESDSTGKDNCCWYHFTAEEGGPPEFYGRADILACPDTQNLFCEGAPS